MLSSCRVKIPASASLFGVVFGLGLMRGSFLDSSEYAAKCDERRAFISGFNGSAGMCDGHALLLLA